jgi:hypothetical protein
MEQPPRRFGRCEVSPHHCLESNRGVQKRYQLKRLQKAALAAAVAPDQHRKWAECQ